MDSNAAFEDLCSNPAFAMLMDNLGAGVVVYSADGRILFANSVMVNWRNIPRQEYMKRNVHDFIPDIDVCVFDMACQQKRPVSRLQYYQNLQQPGGPMRTRLTTCTPIFDGDGTIKYVLTLLQDVDDYQKVYSGLLKKNEILHTERPSIQEEKPGMVAESPVIRQLLSVVDNLAPMDSTVLLCGESGTGKEVFARYIHEHSSRSDKPMITVNCAAIPEHLLEAELFGYEKGSFTGANRQGKMGLAEAANGGTLFLDEVNSLPLEVQGKVLRMIEEKSIQRVGAVYTKKVDFRLIAATNKDLSQMVAQGKFRADLYYRLQVIPLTIPPLRQRREDIAPLCLYFLNYFCKKYNLEKRFAPSVLEEATRRQWPGNVRELRNFVERMVVMTPYTVKEIATVPDGMLPEDSAMIREEPPVKNPVRQGKLSREDIEKALSLCGGHREKTAEYLGISRRQLQYKIKEFHISDRCSYPKEEYTDRKRFIW